MFSLFSVKTSLTAVFIMKYILLRSVLIVGMNIYISVLYDHVIYLLVCGEDLHHNLGVFSFSYIHCGLQLELKEWSVMQKNL